MNRIAITILVAFLLLIFSNSITFAFRCGSKLVSIGDTKVEVLAKCGEPTLKEEISYETKGDLRGSGRYRRRGRFTYQEKYDEVSKKVEKWYYDFGSHKFIRILTFVGGVLKKVEMGGYGGKK